MVMLQLHTFFESLRGKNAACHSPIHIHLLQLPCIWRKERRKVENNNYFQMVTWTAVSELELVFKYTLATFSEYIEPSILSQIISE